MPSQLLCVTYEAADPRSRAGFWAALLRRELVEHGDLLLLPGDDAELGLAFTAGTDPGTPSRMHLHLTSSSEEDQQATVDTALSLGARHLDVGQLPEEGHLVLADPGGNAFCVIEPGNSFLAGCGFLAELACDGGREVGVFWAEALGWPLVWDQDDETAVQSPRGGTKVAWGGTVDSVPASARQRLDLVVPEAELDAEITRLLALGATLLTSEPATATLVDPGGMRLRLRPAGR